MPRLLELFCGTKSVGRAFEAGWEVVSLDIVSKFEPTILCDIRSWDYTTFPGHFDMVPRLHGIQPWTEEVEQGVIDNMIIFQKPFPGAARTELESQLQRAVKVSAKGKHVKCKMDLERCLFWDPGPAEFARRRGRALVEGRGRAPCAEVPRVRRNPL